MEACGGSAIANASVVMDSLYGAGIAQRRLLQTPSLSLEDCAANVTRITTSAHLVRPSST